MNKNEQLNTLFKEWPKKQSLPHEKFIRDGIIDEDKFLKTEPKILFIAKEPNNPEHNEFDFREWWKDDGIYKTFSIRIAEWSYGILNEFPEYDKIRKNESELSKSIQRIAFMNIKKTSGTGNSKLELMMKHLEINFIFLHKQIELINPDIIVTGISWNELRNTLFPATVWKPSGYNIEIGKHNNAKVIDFYHPSSRNAPAAAYCLLKNIIESDKFKQL